jgi:hypothetical protein
VNVNVEGLTPETIELVERSHARLGPRRVALSISFCEELAQHPRLGAVFPVGDVEKRDLAVSFLDLVATNLRSPDRVGQVLERMGARGLLNGLSLDDVDGITKSFLTALGSFESDAWTRETEHAWTLACAWTIAVIRRRR